MGGGPVCFKALGHFVSPSPTLGPFGSLGPSVSLYLSLQTCQRVSPPTTTPTRAEFQNCFLMLELKLDHSSVEPQQ